MLLPDTVVDRQVNTGRLGCPICGRDYPIIDGVARFGAPPPTAVDTVDLDGEGLAALLGVTGPGGYVVLAGSLAQRAATLTDALEGVHLALVNPPVELTSAGSGHMSVLLGPTIPLKARSLRGVALGEGLGADPGWIREGMRTVLPGLRVVGLGPAPSTPGVDILAAADGVWVARVTSGGGAGAS